MRIYCVTRAGWEGMSVELVCTKEIAVVNLVRQAKVGKYIDQLYCRVYDDVGILVDEGHLYKTALLGKIDLSIG